MTKRSRKNQHQPEQSKSSSCVYVSQLLTLLFSHNDLHIPSKKLKHYRNKITYNLPLLPRSNTHTNDDSNDNTCSTCSRSSSRSQLSPLAELQLNEVCQAIQDWTMLCKQREGLFREVMAKCSRCGDIMIRVTVAVGVAMPITRHDDLAAAEMIMDDNNNWGDCMKQAFVSHLIHLFPAITCICYNETIDRSRPTKEAPLFLIFGNEMYITERTLSPSCSLGLCLSYQISPDAFCEVNHEVEELQYQQTVSWIQLQQYQGAILICSGRDINSYGLGFGSLINGNGEKLFSEVIAVQHCPLVAKDAEANFKRHEDVVKATVLHVTKDEMASSVSVALEAALKRQNRPHPSVVVVTTGGRKGLNPGYLEFLKDHQAVECIIYNSCSTKSLEVDISSFMSGPRGYLIDDFRSYDFFAGTKFSASVLRLLRRPKTLVLPIGPSGAGKSTLASTLLERSPLTTCLWWQRDLEFAKLRNLALSMRESKFLLHSRMLSFLKGDCKYVRILDSTNGNAGARLLYLNEAKAEIFILVVLSPSKVSNKNIMESLLERTSDRVEGGDTSHPSFPSTVDEQREKHLAIIKGIEYPSNAEIAALSKECRRTITLQCNPFEVSKLSSLPFEIFLIFSASARLNDILGVVKSAETNQ